VDGGAKQILEEGMEDRGFGMMRENCDAVVTVEVFDLVLLKAARGTKVEVFGIFVSKDAVFDFSPLAPVGGTVSVL
jgi:hypothetical protein